MNMEKLMKELIGDEGCKYEIYLDHLGYPTMGVGHLITEKDEEYGKIIGTPISEDRIKECLDNDSTLSVNETQRNDNKFQAGDVIWNLSTSQLQVWTGAIWIDIYAGTERGVEGVSGLGKLSVSTNGATEVLIL